MCLPGEKDFTANLKKWGGVFIHTSKMNSHCPLSAVLLSFNSFLSRYSISFVLEDPSQPWHLQQITLSCCSQIFGLKKNKFKFV